MNLRIKMTNQETGEFVYVFDKITQSKDAIGMVKRLNEINMEYAKIVGKTIKFFYSIVVR